MLMTRFSYSDFTFLTSASSSAVFSFSSLNRWYKRPSFDSRFTRTALRVVEQAVGERWDGSPLPDKDAGKNPAAVALGKLDVS